MTMTEKSLDKIKNVLQFIATFFAVLSFIFLALLTGLGLLSNSAYKKVTKGSKYVKRSK